MTRSIEQMGDQVQWFGFAGAERWPMLQENGYEEGGICRTSEAMPFVDHDGLKMLYLNVSVDDQLELHGGVFECPADLYEKLHDAVEWIREVIAEYKQTMGSPSDAESEAASLTRPIMNGIKPRLIEARSDRASRLSLVEQGRSGTRLSVTGIHPGTKRRASLDDVEGQRPRVEDGEIVSPMAVPPSKNAAGPPDDALDDESDWEAVSKGNVRTIDLGNKEMLRQFYVACFERIQQTACRQIAQVFVKVVHPKKQTAFPYNGNKRNAAEKKADKLAGKAGAGRPNAESQAPDWWPEGVPHREPAHMKTPDRMKLLIHILCDLRTMPRTGPNEQGVCAADLKAATDRDQTIQKMSKRVKHWLGEIYHIRKADEQDEDGCKRDYVSIHWPSNKRTRNKNDARRRKTDDTREEDDLEHKFEEQTEDQPGVGSVEDMVPMTRNGKPYDRSDSDSERDNAEAWSEYHHFSDMIPATQSDAGVSTDMGKVRRSPNFPNIAASIDAVPKAAQVVQEPPFHDQRVSFAGPTHINSATMVGQPAGVEYSPNTPHFAPNVVAHALGKQFVPHGASLPANGSSSGNGISDSRTLPPASQGAYYPNNGVLGSLPVRSSQHSQVEADRHLPGLHWTSPSLTDPYSAVPYSQVPPLNAPRPNQWESMAQPQGAGQLHNAMIGQDVPTIGMDQPLMPGMHHVGHKDMGNNLRSVTGSRSMGQRPEGLRLAPLGPTNQAIQPHIQQHLNAHPNIPRYVNQGPHSESMGFSM